MKNYRWHSLTFSISYNKVVSYDKILTKINRVVKKQNWKKGNWLIIVIIWEGYDYASDLVW